MRVNRPSIIWYLNEFHDLDLPEGRRQLKIKCIAHNERTPSMAVYPDTDRVCCFAGCFDGRAVDVLDILQAEEGLSFAEAVERSKDWPGTLVDSEPVGSSKKGRTARQKRAPYKFKILGE